MGRRGAAGGESRSSDCARRAMRQIDASAQLDGAQLYPGRQCVSTAEEQCRLENAGRC
jgi:hypothetical protein